MTIDGHVHVTFPPLDGFRQPHVYMGSRAVVVLPQPYGYWTTRGCHGRLCVLSFRSFGGICETASCPVRELAIRELAYPRVVQLPTI